MIIERMKPSSDQLQNKNVFVVKIETTGTEADDEILELCLLDARDPWCGGDRTRQPRPLFHARFRPEYKAEWPRASRVNGITPAMAAKEHFLDEYRAELTPLLMRCDCLVSYNAEFDFAFLRRQFVFRACIMTVDLMRDWTEHVAGDSDSQYSRLPFLPQKDMFRFFDWNAVNDTLSQCMGLRYCFLQLIRMGAIHIRRPLLERRFNRISELQLAEVRTVFQDACAAMGAGPYLDMHQEGEDVRVSLGICDPEKLLYAGDPPQAVLSLSGAGSAAEVRERIATAIAERVDLPPGLTLLACDVLRGHRPAPEGENAQKHPTDTENDVAAHEEGDMPRP